MFKENPLVFGTSEQLKIVNATMSQKNGKRTITIQLGKGCGYSLRSGDGWKIVDATLLVTPPSPPKYLLVGEQKEINFTMPAFSKDIPFVTITPFTRPQTNLKIVPAVLNFSKAGTQRFTLQADALMDSSFALGVTYDALIICLSSSFMCIHVCLVYLFSPQYMFSNLAFSTGVPPTDQVLVQCRVSILNQESSSTEAPEHLTIPANKQVSQVIILSCPVSNGGGAFSMDSMIR